jgi:hypothetical protein
MEMLKQGKIHYSHTFWGFLKSLEEENEPQITNLEENIQSTFYLLINPNNFFSRKFFLVFSHLGDS